MHTIYFRILFLEKDISTVWKSGTFSTALLILLRLVLKSFWHLSWQ